MYGFNFKRPWQPIIPLRTLSCCVILRLPLSPVSPIFCCRGFCHCWSGVSMGFYRQRIYKMFLNICSCTHSVSLWQKWDSPELNFKCHSKGSDFFLFFLIHFKNFSEICFLHCHYREWSLDWCEKNHSKQFSIRINAALGHWL